VLKFLWRRMSFLDRRRGLYTRTHLFDGRRKERLSVSETRKTNVGGGGFFGGGGGGQGN